MTLRLQEIDDTNRHDHHYLSADDECYFLYEYTAGAGWQHPANQLIFNLKKKRGQGGFQYKVPAIVRCARELTPAINQLWLKDATFVPVPPSKIKTDPLYDDRMRQVCEKLNGENGVEVREIVEQIASTDAVHDGNRRSPEELKENYRLINNELDASDPKIAIVDDLLTTGAHFRALKDMILTRKPDAKVVGFFIARRAIPNPFEGLDLTECI